MDITKQIAENLSAWMEATPGLDTIKKLAAKSKVGFGTIQRAKNGDGNITVQNLEAIAHTFGRRAADLLTAPDAPYATADLSATPKVAENIAQFPTPPQRDEAVRELVALAEGMTEQGRWQLLGQAKLLAATYAKAKANPAS